MATPINETYEVLDTTVAEIQVMHVIAQALDRHLPDDSAARARVSNWLSSLVADDRLLEHRQEHVNAGVDVPTTICT